MLRFVVGGALALVALTPAVGQAQWVDAEVAVRGGYSTYADRPVVVVDRERPRRVVVVEHRPRVIVIERVRHPHGRAHGWWRNQGYREARVWYYDGRFYDRHDRGWNRRAREIVVWERNGRYYMLGERDRDGYDRRHDDRYDRHDRDDRRDRDHRDHDRRDRDRWDD